MPQEDKIKRETDRIGLVLAKLLSRSLRKEYPYGDAMVEMGRQFQSELDIDLEEFLAMAKGHDVHFLVNDGKFAIEHLKNFGNLLYGLAHKADNPQQKTKLLQKAHHLYQYISTNHDGTMFLDVEHRLKELG